MIIPRSQGPMSWLRKPTPFCPNPQWWSCPLDVAGPELEIVEFFHAFIRATQPDNVVEFGGGQGATTQAIAYALRMNGHGRLTSIEIDEKFQNVARRVCEGLPVDFVCMSARDYKPARPIDCLLIDSADNMERFLDLLEVREHCPGDILIHDIGIFPELREALRGLHKDGAVDLYELRSPCGVALLRWRSSDEAT